MEEEYRIDVSQQSIDNEKDIAQKCETSKRHDRRHAEAGENAERCGEAQEIDPPHALCFRISTISFQAFLQQLMRSPSKSVPPWW